MTNRAAIAPRNNKRNRRGYSIVEIAIVLTVILIFGSALVARYSQIRDDENNNDAERAIERIHTAVADYAARNRTQSFLLRNMAASVSVVWRMPGDRPHLPCPDISGDGVEDRIPLPPGDLVITVNHTTQVPNGACYALRGLVPWKTLDTDESDPWGGRYSYRVDYDYSHALVGFGERSRADQADDAALLTVVDVAEVTVNSSGVTSTVTVIPHVFRPTWPVSVTIMTPGAPYSLVINTMTLSRTLGIAYVREPSIVCDAAPCPPTTVTLNQSDFQIGVPNPITISVTNNADPVVGVMNLGGDVITNLYDSDVDWPGEIHVAYPPGAVIYGVPVVVLSHGRNQHGAVQANRFPGIVCNATPVNNYAERQNAFRVIGLNFNVSSIVYRCPQNISPGGHPNGFVHRVHGVLSPSVEEYDDIVGWMSSEDLLNEMRARAVFPINKPPPAGLEDY